MDIQCKYLVQTVNLQFVIIKDYLDAGIDASLENGLLTVVLTKKQTSPKTIKIQINFNLI